MRLFKRYPRRVNGKNRKRKQHLIPFTRASGLRAIVARSTAIDGGRVVWNPSHFLLSRYLADFRFLPSPLYSFLAITENLISFTSNVSCTFCIRRSFLSGPAGGKSGGRVKITFQTIYLSFFYKLFVKYRARDKSTSSIINFSLGISLISYVRSAEISRNRTLDPLQTHTHGAEMSCWSSLREIKVQ